MVYPILMHSESRHKRGVHLCRSLAHLTLHYGMRDVGMDYDRAVFGMKLSDCRSLARCLEYCEALVSLDLSNNGLDDDKLRMLASGLVNNLSVVHVNLSGNKIADRGVRAFAKLLHVNSVIQIVDLSNNQVCFPLAIEFFTTHSTRRLPHSVAPCATQ